MPLIQNPSIARKLQRFLRLVDFPDSVLAPETVSVIVVEDLTEPLSDIERGCIGSDRIGGVLAENSIIALVRVGAPARYDLIVQEAFLSSDTTQQMRVIVPTAGLAGLTVSGETSFTDFGLPGRPSSQLLIDTQIAIPAGRKLWEGRVLADTVYRIVLNIRIGTIGQASQLTSIAIVGTTQDTQILGGFKWTESPPQG